MILLASVLAVLAFLVTFSATNIVGRAKSAIAIAQSSLEVIKDRNLTDAQKEKATQAAAIAMLKSSVGIAIAVAIVLGASALPVFLMDLVGLVDQNEVYAFLLRPDVIIITSLLVIAAVWVLSKKNSGKSDYGLTDRILHRIAFAAPFVQRMLSDMEDSAFGGQIKDIKGEPPVFVTSLARAGTTIVLNALSELPGTATHTYRDMPFVMAPLLWSRLSGGFQKGSELKERAHGDGLKIGFDSPEAFEEVIWKSFSPGKYSGDVIPLWTKADKNAELTGFLKKHFRKIVAVRGMKNGRYISKNNGNIAKLDLLFEMFPDARIIVPLRDPAEHAASLLRQHENFLKRHEEDPFSKRYMRDIGHFEFGTLHKPFGFDGVAELLEKYDLTDPNYWLEYWCAFARHVQTFRDKVIIVDEHALQDTPQETMTDLCRAAEIDPGDFDFTPLFRKIPPRADLSRFDTKKLTVARSLYNDLVSNA